MASKTFLVERSGDQPILVKADRAEQDPASTRVTFYTGEGDKSQPVASFINVQGWHEKTA